ncbi:transcriptional activator domain protein [Pseudonocardia dioxanivorans CB1190]|uniref:Transcriptional activator domain protein n=1 Tax=Pseudonocardia dioxanivorans (strain ATCC 55486 / DSM 44775 / JCM 13855 / CB1190) TaxID=675635 RepID=F4CTM4_PSEUX|nr:AAA family ATPase [Pseudonocardia dioxanivorans]AEA28527.1 transcriptional activator domain protein [Pseudonocardia dioxanivorans CB1190]
MPSAARVRLLGPFDIRLGAAGAAPGSARAEALFAYLVLHPETALPRERVASALWPGSTGTQARTNLRHLLHTVRSTVPELDHFVEITGRTLRWRPGAELWLDVAEYQKLLATEDDAARRDALRGAVALYGGEFGEGRDDEWLVAERDRLARLQMDALAELVELCTAAGDVVEATTHAERLLRLDPLREQTYRTLMRLHDAAGDRARAVRAYHLCASTLERELGVEPSEPTRAAYDALLAVPARAPETRGARPALVGRGREQAVLAAAWQEATAGAARLVLVQGEAGIGKSRLVEELGAWCVRRRAVVAVARCHAAEGTLAYGAVVDWLRTPAVRARLARLEPARLTELARLLPELLAEVPGLAAPVPLPPGDQRHRLYDAIAAAVVATRSPTLLVVDDLPEADRETCRLLHYLLRVAADAPLLVVGTARTGDTAPDGPLRELLVGLAHRDRLSEIDLGRLDAMHTAELAARTQGAGLDAADARRLHAETEGNPLYIVEALRGGWTPGAPPSPRVQSVIAGRLARLGATARHLLEVAAAIGREFPVDVLVAAAELDAEDAVRGLDELWRHRIVREQGDGGSYDFSHDRIRQVAYQELSPARRRMLHERIADALERTHGATPDPVSAQVAAHHAQAGAVDRAILWYRRAAAAAQLLHADVRAADLLGRALALAGTRPRSAERDAVELDLRTALLGPLVPVHGYVSEAVRSTQQRILELSAALGVEPAAPALRSLALEALTRGDFAAAGRFGQQLWDAADRGDGAPAGVLAVEAAYVLGIAAFWQNEMGTARDHFERALRCYRPELRRIHLVDYVQDPKVVCQSRLANTLFFLGDPAGAVAARDEALAWAEVVGHRFSHLTALTFAMVLAVDMGDDDAVRRFTVGLEAHGGERVHIQTMAVLRGYVAVLDGAHERGLAAIRAAERAICERPSAPGQAAIASRVLLAALVAAGDHSGAAAQAKRLLAAGGPARLWAPAARDVLARVPADD